MAQHIRRNPRRLPSLQKHGFSALIIFGILVFSLLIWLNLSAKHKPQAKVGEEVTLPKITMQAQKTTPVPLPDLLAPDNIPMDANPTEQLSMVGAPNRVDIPNPTALVGTNTPIRIDGRSMSRTQRTVTKFTPLPRAPIAGMSKITSHGPVPAPHKDGRTPVQAYAKPFTPKKDTKYISLVIGGLGINPSLTRQAINNLPGEVTLSFAASAPGLQSWIDRARAHGHEVIIELPMQGGTQSSDPTSRYTLTTNHADAVNQDNLQYLLSRAQGYFAVTNYDGDVLVNDETSLLPLIKTLKNSGLAIVYDGAIKDARIAPLAKREGLPVITAHTFLDDTHQDAVSVHRNIQSLQQSSYENVPIGMGFSYLGTIDGIANWIAVKPKGVELAPVSYALLKK